MQGTESLDEHRMPHNATQELTDGCLEHVHVTTITKLHHCSGTVDSAAATVISVIVSLIDSVPGNHLQIHSGMQQLATSPESR